MAAKNGSYVDQLLDAGFTLAERKAEIYEQIAANRTALRGALSVATDDQVALINEMYPPKAKHLTDRERAERAAADAEERAARALAKAQEAAAKAEEKRAALAA